MALHVPWDAGFGEFLQLEASPMMTAPGPARQLTSRDRVPPSHALEQSPQVPGVHVYPRKEVPGNVMQPRHLAHVIFLFLIRVSVVEYFFVRVKSKVRIVSLQPKEKAKERAVRKDSVLVRMSCHHPSLSLSPPPALSLLWRT